MENFIDPSVEGATSATIWHYAVVQKNVRLGRGVSIGSHAEISEGCIIGEGCRISKGVFLPKNTHLRWNVFIGPGTILTDDLYPRANKPYDAKPPIVEEEVSIGAGCVILPGVRLGRGCVVGAGTTVLSDVPPYSTVSNKLQTRTEPVPYLGNWNWVSFSSRDPKKLHSLKRSRGYRHD